MDIEAVSYTLSRNVRHSTVLLIYNKHVFTLIDNTLHTCNTQQCVQYSNNTSLYSDSTLVHVILLPNYSSPDFCNQAIAVAAANANSFGFLDRGTSCLAAALPEEVNIIKDSALILLQNAAIQLPGELLQKLDSFATFGECSKMPNDTRSFLVAKWAGPPDYVSTTVLN